MSPYEHQPIIFNYGLQSKVISCPLYSTPDGPVSARMIWGPAGMRSPSHNTNCYSKGESEVLDRARRNLRVAEKKSPPFVTVLLQIQGEHDINRKVFTGSG